MKMAKNNISMKTAKSNVFHNIGVAKTLEGQFIHRPILIEVPELVIGFNLIIHFETEN